MIKIKINLNSWKNKKLLVTKQISWICWKENCKKKVIMDPNLKLSITITKTKTVIKLITQIKNLQELF